MERIESIVEYDRERGNVEKRGVIHGEECRGRLKVEMGKRGPQHRSQRAIMPLLSECRRHV